jgi:hypothetical protein
MCLLTATWYEFQPRPGGHRTRRNSKLKTRNFIPEVGKYREISGKIESIKVYFKLIQYDKYFLKCRHILLSPRPRGSPPSLKTSLA